MVGNGSKAVEGGKEMRERVGGEIEERERERVKLENEIKIYFLEFITC